MDRRRRTPAALIALAAAGALLGGCTGTGNSWNPISRSLGWFNFLNGTDMRRNCGPEAPEHVRFVYNARWGEQVRIYELLPPANPRHTKGAELAFRALKNRLIRWCLGVK